ARQIRVGLALHGLPPFPFYRFAGDSSVGATPVPIPNTVVKPDSADGTPVARPRESRPSPAPHFKRPVALHVRRAFWLVLTSAARTDLTSQLTFSSMTRAGIITVVGKPNAGKSTL